MSGIVDGRICGHWTATDTANSQGRIALKSRHDLPSLSNFHLFFLSGLNSCLDRRQGIQERRSNHFDGRSGNRGGQQHFPIGNVSNDPGSRTEKSGPEPGIIVSFRRLDLLKGCPIDSDATSIATFQRNIDGIFRRYLGKIDRRDFFAGGSCIICRFGFRSGSIGGFGSGSSCGIT